MGGADEEHRSRGTRDREESGDSDGKAKAKEKEKEKAYHRGSRGAAEETEIACRGREYSPQRTQRAQRKETGRRGRYGEGFSGGKLVIGRKS